jgi:hypothetical protein
LGQKAKLLLLKIENLENPDSQSVSPKHLTGVEMTSMRINVLPLETIVTCNSVNTTNL